MSITTKSLYTQINSLIEQKATRYASGAVKSAANAGRQTASGDRDVVSFVNTATTEDVVNSMSDLLNNIVEPRIISGLEVTETTPPSLAVNISAGTGTGGGQFYELKKDIILNIPTIPTVSVYYINVYRSGLKIEYKTNETTLTIAKIIAPFPSYTQAIYDRRSDVRSDDRSKGYIQSFYRYNLYGIAGRFEEDTVDLLRDNIGEILADNLIGNIRLSENLKVLNTAGTLELNSDSIKFRDFDGNNLASFNPSGVYFYRQDGFELAKFSVAGARIGNMELTPTSLRSTNYLKDSTGFSIESSGDAYFNNIAVRGTVFAESGSIGGFTITDNELYATTTGTIKTSVDAGAGANGVVLDKDGIRVYDALQGLVANFPSDGSKPNISAGVIGGITLEVDTNTVIRTSETVGDGSSESFGLLMNSSGLYGCGINQTLKDANFKILADGRAYFRGAINATSGTIGGISIIGDTLVGGILRGSILQGAIIETSDGYPKTVLDQDGISYQVLPFNSVYDELQYGDAIYGAGVTAYLFNNRYPLFTVMIEHDKADIRLYNRAEVPGSGTGPHEVGDLICVNGKLMMCIEAGSPGTFETV